MRGVDADIAMLKRRKLQGDLTMQNVAINESLQILGAKDVLDDVWVNEGSEPQMASATAALTLPTTPADIAGCLITPTRPGFYVALAVFDFLFSVAGNATAIGVMVVSAGTLRSTQALFLDAAAGPIARACVTCVGTWNVPDMTNARIGLQAQKNAATATISANAGNTVLVLWRAGPAH